MTEQVIAVKLVGGPFDGWHNLYDAKLVGGWPLPDEIGAMEMPGHFIGIIADPSTVPPEFEDGVVRYRKVRQSQLPDSVPSTIARGAVYEVVE